MSDKGEEPASSLSMAGAVSTLLNGGATDHSTTPIANSESPEAAAAISPNLANYLQSQQPAAVPATQPWQEDAFRPTTRTIVEAVKVINIQDVQWFLHQLDLQKNGGRRPVAPVVPPSGPLPPAAEAAPALPSPYLDSLPPSALQLPTSSPYILDILLDTVIGLQARAEHAAMRAVKQRNLERAKADGVDVSLVDLLTPLPPITPASLHLPSPQSEHAFQTLQCLVQAVDIVGVNTLSKAAAIDYLKMSDIPYPVFRPSDAEADSPEWSVGKEWKKRVKLLQEYGAVLDVDHQDEDSQSAPPAAVLPESAAAAGPPRLSDFLIPPFTSDRASKEKYLRHAYLTLLEKRQLFITMLSEVLTRVRNARAQSNYQLGLQKADAEKRNAKILADIAAFEAQLHTASTHSADSLSQAQADRAAAEKLERSAASIRREEWAAHREAVAIKGTRIIQQRHAALSTEFEAARGRYAKVRAAGIDGLQAVETSRAALQAVNMQFDKFALTLESRLAANTEVSTRAARLAEYVSEFEVAVKAAKKSLKDTSALQTKSRATAAAMQVAELDISGRALSLIFGPTMGGTSNPFLKLFKCMSGAPDPNDPAPEVVWCPDACIVTELYSPSATRTAAQVASPTWRTIRVDLWKLCEAERDRYFKVELWDCDASVKQVASVVKGAIEQAKIDSEQKTRAALEERATQPQLNPDGTLVSLPSPAAAAPPTSVTLPSTSAIRYLYVGQAVVTLQQLLDAQRKRREDQEATAAVSTQSGIMALPIINAEKWAARASTNYADSGTLIFNSVKITDADA